MDKVKFVLASNSPRRRQLFGLGGWNFTVIAADVDETPFENESPRDYVIRLAQAKALAIQPRAESDAVIIGSDTTVVDGNEILGKPVDEADAERMLKQLRGRVHQVYTAIAVLQNGKMVTELSVVDVPMRDYSDDEIVAYIKTGDPMDKAGAYAIQHPEFQPVSVLEGCRAAVMGLPMCHVLRALSQFEINTSADVPAACQSLLKYDCKVSPAILSGRGDPPIKFN
ncbi:MAG: septum formation protein Maf [Chloroflexi bacterium]|nr:septum formation protein Maf [Chloroflexota bacterium]MBI3167087.1 septum formation protein Maf [Chloroflexota bacterium]